MSNKIFRTFEVGSSWFWVEKIGLRFIENNLITTRLVSILWCVTTSYFHVDLNQPSTFQKISTCELCLAPSSTLGSHPTESAQNLTRRAKHCLISSTYMKQKRFIWHNSQLQIGSIQPKLPIFYLLEASANVMPTILTGLLSFLQKCCYI